MKDEMERKPKISKNSRIKSALFKDKRKKPKKTETEAQEVKRLKNLLDSNQIPESADIKKFMDLPLSKKTLLGLKASGYLKPTEVQRESIPLSLKGLDILGAAKTGSGKTLAFVIPILEKLYLNLWTNMDGLGALIITPTRELAYQIFETLRNVGRAHEFSAALIIGGKDLKAERKRVDQMNIIICTPGRLLQHMDENPNFDCSNLQVLVLDEADRCLDMGFEREMNAIIENLPRTRQTLLFSATQTKSIKDLARLSLKSPVYVSVHENAEHSTPETLRQSYVVTNLEDKLDMLWSFIKHHKRKKILVFLSSCKQVRFIHLLFCRLRPGTSVLALHGGMHQLKRMKAYDDFCNKQNAVLFATDIAARGLDFPQVDWVLQLDCPEDATTYIHRAGRTARYTSEGESLLILLPSEEPKMIELLEKKKIPIQKIEVNQKKCTSVKRKFEALLARDMNLKECAQRAFKSYIKSVFMMKDKEVFDATKLDLDAYASSLGLAVAPRVRFLKPKKSKSSDDDDLLSKIEPNSDSDIDVAEEEEETTTKTKERKTLDFSLPDEGDESDEDADNVETLFKSKKPAEFDFDDDDGIELDPVNPAKSGSKKPKSKAAVAKKLLKKNILTNKKVVFDEEGTVVPDIRRDKQSEKAKSYENEDASGIDIERMKEILKEEDQYDKQIFRERIKAKHREERLKKRLARQGKGKHDEEEAAVLGGEDESGGSDEEPNLDWLPDPDKVYSPEDDDEDHESSEPEDADADEEESFEFNRKRPLESDSSHSDSEPEIHQSHIPAKVKNKKKKLRENCKDLDSSAMEEWALKLLSK